MSHLTQNIASEQIRLQRYSKHINEIVLAKSNVDNKKPILYLNEYNVDLSAYQKPDNTSKSIHSKEQKSAELRNALEWQGKQDMKKRAGANELQAISTRMKNKKNADKQIKLENAAFRCKLIGATAIVDTNYAHTHAQHNKSRRGQTEIPEEILQEYAYIINRQEKAMNRILLRPELFLEFEYYGVRRLTMTLFTEACPELVLEFMCLCATENPKYLQIVRIFSNLWLEGEFVTRNERLMEPNYEYKMNVIDHDIGPGVLSFAKSYLDGFKNGLVNFSIGFRPLKALNSERISFGIVTKGLRNLHCLEACGTTNALEMVSEDRIAFGIVTRGMRDLCAIQAYGKTSGTTKYQISVAECGLL